MALKARALAVWWEDAYSHDGWTHDAETIMRNPCLVLSVGLELVNDDGGIVLAASYNGAGQSGGVWKIPRGMVRRVKVLARLEAPEDE